MMSDIKRPISDVSGSVEPDDKKQHTKPGRKPIETEPKSKRTAQNRAAQRAYRERKERKMKDLEERVKLLEDENLKANTESDFLKAQVDMLKKELTRYRGDSNIVDLNMPAHIGALNSKDTHSRKSETSNSLATTGSDFSVSKSYSDSKSNVSSSDTTPESLNFSAQFPWSKEAPLDFNYKSQVPDLVSGSSCSTSPLDSNNSITPASQIDYSLGNHKYSESSEAGSNKTNILFEEKLDPVCLKLNDACGTKDSPIPKDKLDDYVYNSPFMTLSGENNHESQKQDKGFDFVFDKNEQFDFDRMQNSVDPLSFLSGNTFDINLAFNEGDSVQKQNVDPMSFLTTEESAYDPLNDGKLFEEFLHANNSTPAQTPNGPSSSKIEPNVQHDKDNDDNEIVPAPEPTMKCSEIWDRIVSHPKYTEIDIDVLCHDLRAKAKCSEKGAVIKSSDVNKLIELSFPPEK